jgi:hypothetical protein
MWMPGAIKYDLGVRARGECDSSAAPKAIAHITWDRNATKNKPQLLVPFSNLVNYFTGDGKGKSSHLLWNPFTGQVGQFFPADSRSMSLVDLSGGIRTNRAGKYVIQIEALFFPWCMINGKVYEKLTDTPCKGWGAIQEWTESLGIASIWPGGKPNGYSRDTVSASFFNSHSGWYGHNQVPENTHTDPGYWPNFIKNDGGDKPQGVTGSTIVNVPAFPGRQFFVVGANNKYVTEVDKNLIRLGFTKHNDGNGYQAGPRYTTYTKSNVADFQRSRGWSGSDADGLVGPQTWHDLFTVKH